MFPWEEWSVDKHFCQDTANRPDINCKQSDTSVKHHNRTVNRVRQSYYNNYTAVNRVRQCYNYCYSTGNKGGQGYIHCYINVNRERQGYNLCYSTVKRGK